MNQPRCSATTKSGAACRSFALPGQSSCFMHDPERRDEVAEARSRGALKANKLRSLQGRRRRLDNHAGLSAFVTSIVYDTVEGKLDTDIARTVLYGASILRQLNERDVERRLSEVERLLAQRRPA